MSASKCSILLEEPGHEGLAVHVHAGPALVVVLGELLDPVGGEPGALPLLQHVVGGVGPPVSSHLLKAGPGMWLPLEDPHQQPCALHRALLVQPLELKMQKYKNAEIYWAQEEHKNMGGYDFCKPRLRTAANWERRVHYAGRAPAAAAAAGSKQVHKMEQEKLMNDCFRPGAEGRLYKN